MQHSSKWAFAELRSIIAYKAYALVRSLAMKVDADYTSPGLPACGHTAQSESA